MKNIINIFTVIATVIMFTACNNKNELSSNTPELTKEQKFAKLNYQIAEYNSMFMLQYPKQTNMQKGSWKQFWKVAKADIQGAAAGAAAGSAIGGAIGVIGGGTAAPGAAIGGAIGALAGGITYSVNEVLNPTTTSGTGNGSTSASISEHNYWLYNEIGDYEHLVELEKFDTSMYSVEDNIGCFHNFIIEQMFKDNPDILKISTDELFNSVIEYMKIYFPIKMKNFDVERLKEQVLFNLKYDLPILNTEDDPFPFLSENYPDLKNEIAVIGDYVNTVSRLDPELQPAYSAGIVSLIKGSDLEPLSSLIIISAISVGINSSSLWIETE